MQMTIAKVAEDIAQYDLKKLTDDRTILRRETGDDFLERETNGRLILNVDDAALLCGYADLRRAGYPVKLAGTIMSRIRTAMLATPEADQLMTVTLENGGTFTLDAATLDLSSGYNSGGYITSALLFDVRNYRQRVQRAIDAYEPGIEADDAVAA
jgi:hypothetical protein